MHELRPRDMLQWLLGEWALSREAPGHASMHGHASLEPIAHDSALYREAVLVNLVAQREMWRGQQCYEYRQIAQGFAVYFAPPSPEAGELFHVLEFSSVGDELIACARHECKADVYLSQYIFPADSGADWFRVRHDIEGPRKKYSLVSSYVRQSMAQSSAPMTVVRSLR